MCIQTRPRYALFIFSFFIFFLSINVVLTHGFLSSKKLDESTGGDDPSVKCTPCTHNPPPPPPPPKKPSPAYCPPPPPPPSSFIYILGPPGNLYPIDRDFAGADRRRVAVELSAVALFGLIGFLGV